MNVTVTKRTPLLPLPNTTNITAAKYYHYCVFCNTNFELVIFGLNLSVNTCTWTGLCTRGNEWLGGSSMEHLITDRVGAMAVDGAIVNAAGKRILKTHRKRKSSTHNLRSLSSTALSPGPLLSSFVHTFLPLFVGLMPATSCSSDSQLSRCLWLRQSAGEFSSSPSLRLFRGLVHWYLVAWSRLLEIETWDVCIFPSFVSLSCSLTKQED